MAAEESTFCNGNVALGSPTESDGEEATTRAASVRKAGLLEWLRNSNDIFVKNKTNQTILVYTRAAPRVKTMQTGAQVGLNLNAGFSAAINFVKQVLHDNTTCCMVVDPGLQSSQRIPVMGPTYLSIRRYSKGDHKTPEDWEWDCLEMLVRPGQKIKIEGTAVPMGLQRLCGRP